MATQNDHSDSVKALSNQVDASVELITLYRGRDSATYLASEFMELGEDATPLYVRQNPTENAPWHKMELKDTDAIQYHTEQPITKGSGASGKWDLKALKRLLAEDSNE